MRIPASVSNPSFDVYGNKLINNAVVGHNNAETEINFSPVENSWPDKYNIPGADLPNYTFDGNSGDINIQKNIEKEEGKMILEKN